MRSIIIAIVSILISFSIVADPNPNPDFKVIVTGGLGGLKSGYEFFYDSQLFRLNQKDPKTALKISNTNQFVYQVNRQFYVAEKALSKKQIRKLPGISVEKQGRSALYMGSTAFALRMNEKDQVPEFTSSPVLARDIGGIKRSISWQKKRIDDILVIIVSFDSEDKGQLNYLNNPTHDLEIRRVPAVSGQYRDAYRHVFFARSLASTEQALDIVGKLKKASKVPAIYMDLGDSIAGRDHVSEVDVVKMLELLKSHDPVALVASNSELRSSVVLPGLFKSAPYLMAAIPDEDGEPPVSRQAALGNKKIQITDLGHISEAAEAFLTKNQRALTPLESLAEARATAIVMKPDLVFGLAQDPQSAAIGNQSALFDAVFSLVRPNGVLPSRDEMQFDKSTKEGLRSVSPLVRVAPTDVTEVSFFLDDKGNVQKLLIDRHPVVDAPSFMAPVEFKSALPARQAIDGAEHLYWESSDYDVILGEMLRDAHQADVAMFEKTGARTPIDGEIPLALAHSYLNRPGRAISFILRGESLKKILKLVSSGEFSEPVAVVGATLVGPTVDQRAIQDAEPYQLVTTEKVGATVYEILDRGSLFEENPNGLAYIEKTLQKKIKLGGISKKRPSQQLEDRLALIRKSPSISALVQDKLMESLSTFDLREMFDFKGGKLRPAVIFDVGDLDLGIDGNWTNSRGDALNALGVPDGRLKIDPYLHLLFNSNLSLKFVTRPVDITLQNKIKFYTSGRNTKPTADSFELFLDFRIPIERLDNLPPEQWALSPLGGVAYETQLWPLPLISAETNEEGESWGDRTRLLRAYLGGELASISEGELFRINGLVQYDLKSGIDFDQSFDWGVEASANHKWKMGIASLKAEGFVRFLFPVTKTPDAERLGFMGGAKAKFEVPLWRFLSLALSADVYAGSTMVEPTDFGVSSIIGVSLSYSQNVRWIL